MAGSDIRPGVGVEAALQVVLSLREDQGTVCLGLSDPIDLIHLFMPTLSPRIGQPQKVGANSITCRPYLALKAQHEPSHRQTQTLLQSDGTSPSCRVQRQAVQTCSIPATANVMDDADPAKSGPKGPKKPPLSFPRPRNSSGFRLLTRWHAFTHQAIS